MAIDKRLTALQALLRKHRNFDNITYEDVGDVVVEGQAHGWAANQLEGTTLEAWKEATKAVHALHEMGELVVSGPTPTRCHELARAVHAWLQEQGHGPWTLVDGRYGVCDHSWLRQGFNILDVYAVGSVPMVQLRDVVIAREYHAEGFRLDIRTDVVLSLLEALRTNHRRNYNFVKHLPEWANMQKDCPKCSAPFCAESIQEVGGARYTGLHCAKCGIYGTRPG